MSSAQERSWPFLAILMSSPQTSDDDDPRPRTRGLGFVYGSVIVTLAGIAEGADLANLGGETTPVQQAMEDGDLALLDLSGPAGPRQTVGQLSAGTPVTVSFVSDISPSTRIVTGVVEASGNDPQRLVVALDDRVGEDWTASGSPIISGGDVVGIVSSFASTGSVSAIGADTIRRLLAAYEGDRPAGA